MTNETGKKIQYRLFSTLQFDNKIWLNMSEETVLFSFIIFDSYLFEIFITRKDHAISILTMMCKFRSLGFS